ncbi:glycosyltransferase [Nocardioides psychrotolerans]|uniref:glycosyltransferase n=1 Tax=Nocardioides psychrotolerans TaxID=1005945 RepID=UPI003137BDE3
MTTRVLVVGHSAALSGAELFLAGMLEHSRVEATVLLLEDGPLADRLRGAGADVRVRALPEELADVTADGGGLRRGVTGFPRVVRDVAAVMRDVRPEVVYTNSAKAHVLAIPVARAWGLPSVLHAHVRADRDSFNAVNLRLVNVASGLATHVIANSEATRATLPQRVRDRSTVVYCPTEVRDVAPVTPIGDRLSIACVGRIAEWKGQRVAVEALRAVLAARGAGAAELHLYGGVAFEKDRAYERELLDLVGRHGLQDLVHLHGHVADVHTTMRSHDVVVHTSTKPEPFGQVVVEAMAAGVPVVAADTGGPAEIVEDGVTGLLYRTGDAAALGSALERLVDEPSLGSTLARNALVAVRCFSYETIVPEWERVLRSVADQPGRSVTRRRDA